MTARRTVRIAVSGRVQGVGYRAFVEREAVALGLSGFVRNRRDGSVEAVFSGAAERVEAALAACRRGPRGARVDTLEIVEERKAVDGPFLIAPST